MKNVKEYNMNGTISLGVDAGYGNFKTARTCFPTSVTKCMSEPTISKDYVELVGDYDKERVTFISECEVGC